MITINAEGTAISQSFIDEIRSDSPNTIARLMVDGAELTADIVEITAEKCSIGEEYFSLGDVIGTKLTATLKNVETPLKGRNIEFQIGAYTGAGYEFVTVCTVNVSTAPKTRYQTDVTAYSSVISDTVAPFDVSNLPSNPTIQNVADAIATQMGRTITFDSSIDTTPIMMASLNGLTLYRALQVIAVCSGGYVINSADNNVKVVHFDATPTLNVDTGMMVELPKIEQEAFLVSGIKCVVQEESEDEDGEIIPEIAYSKGIAELVAEQGGATYTIVFSDGSAMSAVSSQDSFVNVTFQSQYVTNDIFNANIANIVGYEYYPAEVGLTLGDPRLEADDVLSLTDVDGTIYTVPCHHITHTYKGGFTSQITAVDATDEADDIGSVPPITTMLKQTAKDIVKAQNTASNAQRIAKDNAQYFWFLEEAGSVPTGVGTGAHISEIPKEQFLADPTTGGGNLLARSNGVAVRDGLTELASFGENIQLGKDSSTHLLIDSGHVYYYGEDGDFGGDLAFGVNYADDNYVNLASVAETNDQASIECRANASGRASMILMNARNENEDPVYQGMYDDGSINLSKDLFAVGLSEHNLLVAQMVITDTNFVINDGNEDALSLGVTDGSLFLKGEIYGKNHNSGIGTTNSNSGSKSVSPASAPYTPSALSGAIKITSGTWMLVGNASFQANTGGVRYLDWHQNSTSLANTAVTQQAVSVSGVTTKMQTTAIVNVPEGSSYDMYLYCYQTSSATLTVNYSWSIVRII